MNLQRLTIAITMVTILFVGGSLALVGRQNKTAVSPETAATEPTTEDAPRPRIVTLEQLAPEELIRVYLQAWFRRDFQTQYRLLTPILQLKQPLAGFRTAMEQSLPTISGVKIVSIETVPDTETRRVTIERTIDGVAASFTTIFLFTETPDGWRIAEIPELE